MHVNVNFYLNRIRRIKVVFVKGFFKTDFCLLTSVDNCLDCLHLQFHLQSYISLILYKKAKNDRKKLRPANKQILKLQSILLLFIPIGAARSFRCHCNSEEQSNQSFKLQSSAKTSRFNRCIMLTPSLSITHTCTNHTSCVFVCFYIVFAIEFANVQCVFFARSVQSRFAAYRVRVLV